ncbi:SDR family NAD(P)-dependent oxidoreductase [Acidovorax sp.]|uniref:SDR family NAD(P)-dependent oxidoreductase n=1 Tax=Acidovorax sp. TaxID=1872122 RepID=UPI0025BA52CD|nr:SDR family NAD(P)-dependent oxidoreductase [Acidovorax sp.]MBL7091454.1 SDR family NAD(P)-dependent oxidoreductase [Acidovorax sp.]
MAHYLITGATSGLGREVALRLARMGGHQLTLPARDAAKAESFRAELLALGAGQVRTPALDLSSLQSTASFVSNFLRDTTDPVDGVLFNAGRQSATRLVKTADGFESTFAVNHLAHHLILKGLTHRLTEASIVGWTASGTHDPAEKSARLSGFRGARYTTAARIAQGSYDDASDEQACRDAYATSKLCNIVSARALADEAGTRRTYFSFDPGLMPGTGLAREQSAAMYWVWNNILPLIARLLPGTSSTARSSAVLADLLVGKLRGSHNGAYFNYTGGQLEPASPAKDRRVAHDLFVESDCIVGRYAW